MTFCLVMCTFPKTFDGTSLCSVLSEQVLLMFKAYPTLIVDHCSDITDFVTLRNLSQAKEEFFLHTVSEQDCI